MQELSKLIFPKSLPNPQRDPNMFNPPALSSESFAFNNVLSS